MRDQVQPAAGLGPARRPARDRVARVPVASADHRKVDGQHQHRRADGVRAGHQLLGVAAVAHHVQLKPGRHRRGPGDLLDAAHRHGRLDERDAGALRRARGLHLGTLGEHPAESDRGEDHRQRQALAEQLHGRIARRHVAHHDLAQQQALEIADVGAQRGLLVGAAVDVVEQLAGQPASRQLAVVEHGRRRYSQGPVSSEAHGATLLGLDAIERLCRPLVRRRRRLRLGLRVGELAFGVVERGGRLVAPRLRGVGAPSAPARARGGPPSPSLGRPSEPGRVRARGPRRPFAPGPVCPSEQVPCASARARAAAGRGVAEESQPDMTQLALEPALAHLRPRVSDPAPLRAASPRRGRSRWGSARARRR